jgi:hypothetical protein
MILPAAAASYRSGIFFREVGKGWHVVYQSAPPSLPPAAPFRLKLRQTHKMCCGGKKRDSAAVERRVSGDCGIYVEAAGRCTGSLHLSC